MRRRSFFTALAALLPASWVAAKVAAAPTPSGSIRPSAAIDSIYLPGLITATINRFIDSHGKTELSVTAMIICERDDKIVNCEVVKRQPIGDGKMVEAVVRCVAPPQTTSITIDENRITFIGGCILSYRNYSFPGAESVVAEAHPVRSEDGTITHMRHSIIVREVLS